VPKGQPSSGETLLHGSRRRQEGGARGAGGGGRGCTVGSYGANAMGGSSSALVQLSVAGGAPDPGKVKGLGSSTGASTHYSARRVKNEE